MATKTRGLALMTPEQRSAIARIGGKAANAQGRAHTSTREAAAAAGRKGGLESGRRRAKVGREKGDA
jgi:general stress protein YciG